MKPIIVLQMQRMGDLVLSFPLFMWLERVYPGHPIWVVAEKAFYAPLMGFSPQVTFFPWTESGLAALKRNKYRMVLNLSIRPEASALAGELDAEQKIGAVATPEGSYVLGQWQLYRASLTHNNRHGRFHWADLNALDAIPYALIRSTGWPEPDHGRGGRKVGVFVGASDPWKRPTPGFWRTIIGSLLKRGFEPVVFGGPGETDLARGALQDVGGPVTNLCGRLSLTELAAMMSTLRLFITPDTGPMHLAAWTGTPVLNLSMGNVNPFETGPYQTGHHVLQSTVGCAGCWECVKPRLYCHRAYKPTRAGSVARFIADGAMEQLGRMKVPGLNLMASSRIRGLYQLDEVWPGKCGARRLVGDFWRDYFGHVFGLWEAQAPAGSFKALRRGHEKLAGKLGQSILALVRTLARGLAAGHLPDGFWNQAPPVVRPLSGYVHLLAQNQNYGPQARTRAMELVEIALSATRR